MAKDLIEIVKEVAIWAKGAPVQAGILAVVSLLRPSLPLYVYLF